MRMAVSERILASYISIPLAANPAQHTGTVNGGARKPKLTQSMVCQQLAMLFCFGCG